MTSEPILSTNAPAETTSIARAASVIALGNIISRILGLAREIVKSNLFGAGWIVDAFNVATIVPTMLYDLLVGGMVNSALVPVFTEYAENRREELWTLVNAVLSLAVMIMAGFILIVELFPYQIAFLISRGSDEHTLQLAASLLRITVPAVFFLSLTGVLSGLLYALKRFAFPAFAAATFNAGIVIVTLLLYRHSGIQAMAWGLLSGSLLQMLLQLVGLRDAKLRLNIRLHHTGLKRIGWLYLPIALVLFIDIFISRPVSYNLASLTGQGGISWMNYATYLRQLPQGIVAMAVSFAILPTLSAHASQERETGDHETFRMTLAQGMRLVIVLIIPACVGLFVLARPTVDLLYEHGNFHAFDTSMTAFSLQLYLIGLPFAALDLLLMSAFYAHNNTWTPSLIGIWAFVIYLVAALILIEPAGLFSLMIADSLKQIFHMGASMWILGRNLKGFGSYGTLRTLGIVLAAAVVMGMVVYGTLQGVHALLPEAGILTEIAAVFIPGMAGIGIYGGLLTLLNVSEIQLLWQAICRN